MHIRHVISVSGGKDSTATLLLALERVPREQIVAFFLRATKSRLRMRIWMIWKITWASKSIASKPTFLPRSLQSADLSRGTNASGANIERLRCLTRKGVRYPSAISLGISCIASCAVVVPRSRNRFKKLAGWAADGESAGPTRPSVGHWRFCIRPAIRFWIYAYGKAGFRPGWPNSAPKNSSAISP